MPEHNCEEGHNIHSRIKKATIKWQNARNERCTLIIEESNTQNSRYPSETMDDDSRDELFTDEYVDQQGEGINLEEEL